MKSSNKKSIRPAQKQQNREEKVNSNPDQILSLKRQERS